MQQRCAERCPGCVYPTSTPPGDARSLPQGLQCRSWDTSFRHGGTTPTTPRCASTEQHLVRLKIKKEHGYRLLVCLSAQQFSPFIEVYLPARRSLDVKNGRCLDSSRAFGPERREDGAELFNTVSDMLVNCSSRCRSCSSRNPQP